MEVVYEPANISYDPLYVCITVNAVEKQKNYNLGQLNIVFSNSSTAAKENTAPTASKTSPAKDSKPPTIQPVTATDTQPAPIKRNPSAESTGQQIPPSAASGHWSPAKAASKPSQAPPQSHSGIPSLLDLPLAPPSAVTTPPTASLAPPTASVAPPTSGPVIPPGGQRLGGSPQVSRKKYKHHLNIEYMLSELY